jgi:hypothetical protein
MNNWNVVATDWKRLNEDAKKYCHPSIFDQNKSTSIKSMFQPVNSLVVNRNMWPILSGKIRLFEILSNMHQKYFKPLKIPNMCSFFLGFWWLLSYQQ